MRKGATFTVPSSWLYATRRASFWLRWLIEVVILGTLPTAGAIALVMLVRGLWTLAGGRMVMADVGDEREQPGPFGTEKA